MPQSLEIGWHRTFLIGMSTFQDVFKKKEGNEMKKKKKEESFIIWEVLEFSLKNVKKILIS